MNSLNDLPSNTEAAKRVYSEDFVDFLSHFNESTHETFSITKSFFNVAERLTSDEIAAIEQNPSREPTSVKHVCEPLIYTMLHRLNICKSEKDFRVFDVLCLIKGFKHSADKITLRDLMPGDRPNEKDGIVMLSMKRSRQIYEKFESKLIEILQNEK